MSDEIRVGDIVVLKSGGPQMVVAAVSLPVVKCAWHLKDGKLACEEFIADILSHSPIRFSPKDEAES